MNGFDTWVNPLSILWPDLARTPGSLSQCSCLAPQLLPLVLVRKVLRLVQWEGTCEQITGAPRAAHASVPADETMVRMGLTWSPGLSVCDQIPAQTHPAGSRLGSLTYHE